MIDENKIRPQIEDYLLNKSSDDARQEIEKQMLTDDEFYQFFLTVESDLYEKYIDSEYSPQEKDLYEKYFLAHPDRQQDLWMTQALREKRQQNIETLEKLEPSGWKFDWRKLIPVFASLLIIIGGIYWWNNAQNAELNKGLASLKEAYKNERPLESRLSDFDYAPFSQMRGSKKENDSIELTLAERYLLEAVKNRPNADSYYAIGKFYLAKNNFDKAIEYFKQSQNINADNPKLNNDFGVVYLEKGKSDSLSGEKGKAAIEFNQSLEFFNKSLTQKPNAPEVLFNRAKVYQNLALPEKSASDWQKYIEIDSTSKWADEAREQLKLIEQKK